MKFEEQDRLQQEAVTVLCNIQQCMEEWETWAEMGILQIGLQHMLKLIGELERIRDRLGNRFPEDIRVPLNKMIKPWITPVTLPGGEYHVSFPD